MKKKKSQKRDYIMQKINKKQLRKKYKGKMNKIV